MCRPIAVPFPAAAAVAALAVLVFLPSLWAGFAADDFTMLSTVEALDGPLWAFERNDLGVVDGGHFYRPLWVLLNFGAFVLGGGGALAFHAINLALWALIVVQVVLLVRALAGRFALLAGVAFALYPRHAESVAWVSGNTDLLATALGLGAVQCAVASLPARRRMASAVALTALAALAKESAFVLPALAALALWACAPEGADRRELLRVPAAMALALVPIFALRLLAIGGLGGYSDGLPGATTLVGSLASYAVATVTPHQLEVVRHPLLLAIPLAFVALASVTAWRLHTHGERARLRLVILGLVWFVMALAPALAEPLDLNNATGERLLFLPSVGLALLLAALLPDRTQLGRWGGSAAAGCAALAVLFAAAAALCLASAANWVSATDLAERTVDQALAAAPPSGGELVLLSIPESYRNAHVFTNSFDRAVQRQGRTDLRVSWCAPVHVRARRPGSVRFVPRADGVTFIGRARPSSPFDFPVFGDPAPLSAGCGYQRTASADSHIPGLSLEAIAVPNPQRRGVVTLAFDGRDVRVVEPAS